MVRRVYGHLGRVRHRADVVEYRLEQHVAKLGGRLEALRSVGFVTTCVTTALDSQPDRVSAVAATPRASFRGRMPASQDKTAVAHQRRPLVSQHVTQCERRPAPASNARVVTT